MSSNFWDIKDDLENHDFSSPSQYKLFPSREVVAGGPAGTVCLTQPVSSLVAGKGHENVVPLPMPVAAPHLPFSCCTHGTKEHKISVPKAVNLAHFAMVKHSLKQVQRQIFF